MATTNEFFEYVSNITEDIGDVTYRRMMGEYLVYFCGVLVGGIYDNRLLVKITPSSERILKNSPKVYPYEGAKQLMAEVDCENDRDKLAELFLCMYAELMKKGVYICENEE